MWPNGADVGAGAEALVDEPPMGRGAAGDGMFDVAVAVAAADDVVVKYFLIDGCRNGVMPLTFQE